MFNNKYLSLLIIVLIVSFFGAGIREVIKLPPRILFLFSLRGMCLVIAMYLYFISLGSLPLSEVVSIFFVSPLLITLLSSLILKEKIGIQRWMAVLFGFIGVLIILNPADFIISFDALLPVAGAFVLGFYTILTRKVSETDTSETSFFWVAMVGCAVMSIIGPFFWEPIFFKDWTLMALLCILSTVGHFLLIKAYENAEASVLQPFTYFQLFFASIIGIYIFNDKVTLSIFLGGSIVVASGIFAAWRNYIKTKK